MIVDVVLMVWGILDIGDMIPQAGNERISTYFIFGSFVRIAEAVALIILGAFFNKIFLILGIILAALYVVLFILLMKMGDKHPKAAVILMIILGFGSIFIEISAILILIELKYPRKIEEKKGKSLLYQEQLDALEKDYMNQKFDNEEYEKNKNKITIEMRAYLLDLKHDQQNLEYSYSCKAIDEKDYVEKGKNFTEEICTMKKLLNEE